MSYELIPCPVCKGSNGESCMVCLGRQFLPINTDIDCPTCGLAREQCVCPLPYCDGCGLDFPDCVCLDEDEPDPFDEPGCPCCGDDRGQCMCKEIMADLREEGAIVSDDGMIRLR